MKIDLSMCRDDLFEVEHWYAKESGFVIDALVKQLKAAQAIWPELEDYAIVRKPDPQL